MNELEAYSVGKNLLLYVSYLMYLFIEINKYNFLTVSIQNRQST
jgi:hypothetical protein